MNWNKLGLINLIAFGTNFIISTSATYEIDNKIRFIYITFPEAFPKESKNPSLFRDFLEMSKVVAPTPSKTTSTPRK